MLSIMLRTLNLCLLGTMRLGGCNSDKNVQDCRAHQHTRKLDVQPAR